MTAFYSGTPFLGGMSDQNIQTIELRVISNILQAMQPNSGQEELRILRNDQAFELGLVPPIVPGN